MGRSANAHSSNHNNNNNNIARRRSELNCSIKPAARTSSSISNHSAMTDISDVNDEPARMQAAIIAHLERGQQTIGQHCMILGITVAAAVIVALLQSSAGPLHSSTNEDPPAEPILMVDTMINNGQTPLIYEVVCVDRRVRINTPMCGVIQPSNSHHIAVELVEDVDDVFTDAVAIGIEHSARGVSEGKTLADLFELRQISPEKLPNSTVNRKTTKLKKSPYEWNRLQEMVNLRRKYLTDQSSAIELAREPEAPDCRAWFAARQLTVPWKHVSKLGNPASNNGDQSRSDGA